MNTPDDPIINEIRETVKQSTRFMDYVADRERGMAPEKLVDKYPQAAAFEKTFLDNIMARQADDLVCQCCGRRGHLSIACSREESPFAR